MIGFVQTVPNNIEGFSGFAIESLENVLVRVKDELGNPIEDALVTLNFTQERTNNSGFAEFEELGAYTIQVSNPLYSTFNDVGIISGNVVIDIILTGAFSSSINTVNDGALLWSPIVNSFKFINQQETSFLDTESLNDLSKEEYMYSADYCQAALVGESRQIQFHSNGSGHTVQVFDFFTDLVVDSSNAISVASAKKTLERGNTDVDYNIYQALIFCPNEGTYYVKIDNTDQRSIRSEPFSTFETLDDHVNIEFQNDANTENNYWKGDFIPRVRIQAQLFKRQTEGSRTIFRGSDDFAQVLSFTNERVMLMETFQLPAYMHEILAVGTSGSKFRVDSQEFYTDESYSAPEYIDRYSLANGSITCKTTQGMKQQIDATVVTGVEPAYVINDVEDNISDINDNLIIQP